MRLYCLFVGLRLRIHGLENIPSGSCVVAANHASYLDGPLLSTALPSHFSLVIKNGAAAIPAVGFFLGRLEHLLVERRKPRQAALDAQRVIAQLCQGHAIALFPEGTFQQQAGLQAFKTSAFIGAQRHQRPVLPVSIRGSRRIWPDKRFTLRPGVVEIDVLAPITPTPNTDSERLAARQLAEQCRQAIAAKTQEPLL